MSFQALWKRRSLQLLDLLREVDPAGAGLSLPDLRRATGLNRSRLMCSLTWLVEHSAVSMTLDADKRTRWSALPEDADGDIEPRDAVVADRLEELRSEAELIEMLHSLS